MSAIAGWFGREPAEASGRVAHLLQLMPTQGGDRIESWEADGAALGVARFEWQQRDDLEGTLLVAASDRVVVVSDANVYDTDALLSELRHAGGRPRSADSAALLLAAYEAWGTDLARHLNGDFAFIIWDRTSGKATLCRDLIGRRTLFTRRVAGGLAVASRARALARGIDPPSPVNLALVAAAASALPGGSTASGFEDVLPVPAGATLEWSATSGLTLLSQWEPPPFQVHGQTSMADAAEELRQVLAAAVRGREARDRTVVWLSGGADSTAIFASASAVAEREGRTGAVRPVSLTFPAGDLAREDDHIEALADRWSASVTWVDSDRIPLFDDYEARASRRDDPFAHTFEAVNRALARASAGCGARVVLNGYGGDALFEVSRVYLADLLLARDVRGWWQARRASGLADWRSTIRWTALPLLPESWWRAIEVVRRHAFERPFRYPVVPWVASPIRSELLDRGWDHVDLRPHRGEGPAAFESRSALAAPHFARAISWTRDQSLSSGVEVRSPFMDRRVIELAASRPVAERAWQGNGKRLLKAAMKGLIPDSVLAPRPFKTGVASSYLQRQFQRELRDRLDAVFASGGAGSALADHGLIDPTRMLEASAGYSARPDHLTGVSLYLTLEAEAWLRSC